MSNTELMWGFLRKKTSQSAAGVNSESIDQEVVGKLVLFKVI